METLIENKIEDPDASGLMRPVHFKCMKSYSWILCRENRIVSGEISFWMS